MQNVGGSGKDPEWCTAVWECYERIRRGSCDISRKLYSKGGTRPCARIRG